MAKDTRLNIVVDNGQAIPAIEETGKAVEDLKNKSRGATKETKKDWGGLADIFSSVMPRSLSKVIRSFKSTTRQVTRASRSFKILRGAIVSTGIGILVIALGELIANWEYWSDLIGITNQQQRDKIELDKKIEESQGALTASVLGYLSIIENLNTEESVRLKAIEKINSELGNFIDLEADANTQREQASELIALNLNLEKERILVNDKQLAFEKASAEYGADDTNVEKIEAYLKAAEELNEVTASAFLLEIELNEAISKRQDAINDAAKAQAEAERKAAAEKSRREALEKSNQKFLLQLEKDLNEQILLAGIEGEQARAEKVLELRHKEGLEKARIAGATAEQLLLIEDGYELDLAELRKRFKDDAPDPQDIIDDQEALREELRRVDLNENEKDVQQAQDLFDERLELAHGNRELEKQAEELFESEIDAIQVFYRDKKAADDQAAKEREIADAQEVRDDKLKAIYAVANATSGIFANLEGLAEEGTKKQKHLAIIQVLLSQAVAISKAVEGATKAAAETGAAAPVTFVAYMATMLGGVLTAFRQVKGIMSQAGAGAGLGGSASTSVGAPTVPLIPLGRLGSPDTNNQAYVVQSQLEGQNLNAEQIRQQTVL